MNKSPHQNQYRALVHNFCIPQRVNIIQTYSQNNSFAEKFTELHHLLLM